METQAQQNGLTQIVSTLQAFTTMPHLANQMVTNKEQTKQKRTKKINLSPKKEREREKKKNYNER